MSKKSTVDSQQSTVNTKWPDVFGLVLVGGKSSRMGSDKSLLEYHGKPQREYLFELLSKLCSKVFTSCKSGQQIPSHLNPLPDQFEIESPLNGILTALTHNPNVSWFVVAADMPMVTEGVLTYLLKNRKPEKVATCFLDSDRKNPEPLLSLWEPKALPLIQSFYKKGKISPRDFLKESDINLLEPLSDTMNLNINTPEEFKSFSDKDQLS